MDIASLQLINTDTQKIVGPISDGDTIDITKTPHISIQALPNPLQVGSVSFTLDGNTHIENFQPYTILGDGHKITLQGTVQVFNGWTPAIGSHTLIVTPWELSNGKGKAGTPLTIHFTASIPVPPPPPVPTPTIPAFTYNGQGDMTYDGQGNFTLTIKGKMQ